MMWKFKGAKNGESGKRRNSKEIGETENLGNGEYIGVN